MEGLMTAPSLTAPPTATLSTAGNGRKDGQRVAVLERLIFSRVLLVDREERAPLEFFQVRKSGFDLAPRAGDVGRRRQVATQLVDARRLSAGAEQERIDFDPFAVHRPQAYSNFNARSKTSDGAMRVMQRWSIGHSRSIQRAHSTPSARIASARGPRGAVSNSLVGPKIVSVGRPSAAATWAGPVSLLTSRSQASRAPINSAGPVSPARLIAPRRFICRMIRSTPSRSEAAPMKTIREPSASISRSASAAKRSSGQRFARLLVAPALSATSGRESESTPARRSKAPAARRCAGLAVKDGSGSET